MSKRKKGEEIAKQHDHLSLIEQCGVASVEHDIVYGSSRTTYKTDTNSVGAFPRLNECSGPFQYSQGNRFIHARDAIKLCLNAYWNPGFPLLRNVVEVQVELSNSQIYMKGSNKRTRDFVANWMKKIGIENFKQQWFREYFRSANPFTFRYDGVFNPKGIETLRKGGFTTAAKVEIPVRYEMLNPEYLVCLNNLSLGKRIYYQELQSWQLKRILNPITKEDKDFIKQLTPDSIKDLKTKNKGYLELNPDKLTFSPYKCQDYEPFGVPMAYGVLKDIEAKLELKRIDLDIARTVDRAFLLITAGESPTAENKGQVPVAKRIEGLREMLMNEAVARTIITDWTVKAEWLIPDINQILGTEKYEQLDKDISQGLNAIIFDSGEKFANTSVKVKVFIERLNEARQAFLDFFNKELERVCEAIGAKSAPELFFKEFDLKDDLQYMKLGVQMAQYGLLTPEEFFEYMENGKIPNIDDSIISQSEYKVLKEKGYYMPMMGGSTEMQRQQLEITKELGIQNNQIKQQQIKQAGRPGGTKAPQSTKRQTPIGANIGFSMKEICDKLPKAHGLLSAAEEISKKKYGVESLEDSHKSLARYAVEALISNEEESDWDSKLDDYIINNKEVNKDKLEQIQAIQSSFGCDSFTAAILQLTVKELQSE